MRGIAHGDHGEHRLNLGVDAVAAEAIRADADADGACPSIHDDRVEVSLTAQSFTLEATGSGQLMTRRHGTTMRGRHILSPSLYSCDSNLRRLWWWRPPDSSWGVFVQ